MRWSHYSILLVSSLPPPSLCSSTSLIHTPAHTPPTDTHLPNTPTNLSSDFQAPRVMSSRVHRLSDKKHADDVDLPLEITPILMSRKLMHERNFSDVGCVGKDVTMATKEKVHRRNLSDSLVMASGNITIAPWGDTLDQHHNSSMGGHTGPTSQ